MSATADHGPHDSRTDGRTDSRSGDRPGPSTMRRAVYVAYGSPSVLRVEDAPVPSPGPKQVLIRNLSSSVNGGDLSARAGHAKAMTTMASRGFPKGIGMDVVGSVEAVGDRAGDWRPGDMVWGVSTGFDANAEYVVMNADRVARIPEGIELRTAGALPVAGTTAMAAVDRFARVRPRDTVLVRGGAGGVGSAIVQLAHLAGGRVTALASEPVRQAVLDLGADEVLDYHETRPSDLPEFDVIIDTVGTDLEAFRQRLAPSGRFVTITADLSNPIKSAAAVLGSTRHGRQRIQQLVRVPKTPDLRDLSAVVGGGDLIPVVEAVYPLEEIAEAHKHAERHDTVGKVVLDLS